MDFNFTDNGIILIYYKPVVHLGKNKKKIVQLIKKSYI
jgi:hypothetical protein